jgi:ABC-2 type transport system permease protein
MTSAMSPLRTSWLVARQEARLLLADRTLWIISALFVAIVGYGLFNGVKQAALKETALASVLDAQARGEQSRRATLRRILGENALPDPFANPADPSAMGGGYGGRYAYMPISPLAPLAFGQSDIRPDYYKVTNRSKINFLYDTEIENPWNLLSGHFDLSFVIVYLFPLLIFALSYNFLSAEREHGTLRMLLSQAVRLQDLVAGKIAVRAAVLLAWAVVVPVVALAILRPDARSAAYIWPLASWGAFVVAYAAIWFALAFAVNAFGRSSAANALILIGTWIVCVLILPVLLNVAVSLASPVPSRTELATRTRLVTGEALTRYATLLSADYQYVDNPELLRPQNGRFVVAGRMRGTYLMERDVDQQLEGLLDSFNRQLARQQELISSYGAISPAIVAYEGLTAVAGTGVRRHLHFQQQIDAFHASWRDFFDPKIQDGIAVSEADLDRMPAFRWREEDPGVVSAGVLFGLLQLVLPAAALTALGMWRLRRYTVV